MILNRPARRLHVARGPRDQNARTYVRLIYTCRQSPQQLPGSPSPLLTVHTHTVPSSCLAHPLPYSQSTHTLSPAHTVPSSCLAPPLPYSQSTHTLSPAAAWLPLSPTHSPHTHCPQQLPGSPSPLLTVHTHTVPSSCLAPPLPYSQSTHTLSPAHPLPYSQSTHTLSPAAAWLPLSPPHSPHTQSPAAAWLPLSPTHSPHTHTVPSSCLAPPLPYSQSTHTLSPAAAWLLLSPTHSPHTHCPQQLLGSPHILHLVVVGYHLILAVGFQLSVNQFPKPVSLHHISLGNPHLIYVVISTQDKGHIIATHCHGNKHHITMATSTTLPLCSMVQEERIVGTSMLC